MAWWYHSAKAVKSRMLNIIICLSVTLLFWGFRGFCFYDWMSYYPMFNGINIYDCDFSSFSSREPGFTLLMLVCKAVFNNWHFFVFICTCINLALLTRFLYRHIENLPLGLMVCTAMGGLFLMTDLMRNSIAVFIFINSIEYIRDRKFIKYFIACIFAVSFHYSAVLYFPLYFFIHRQINKWWFAAVFGIGCVVFALHIPIFTSSLSLALSAINPDLEVRLRFYLMEIANNAPGVNIVFLERLLTGFLVICYMDKLRSLRADANIYINCLLFFFIMSFYFGEFVTFSMRLSLLFVCGYWIVWIDLIKCFSISTNKKLFIAFISIYCALRMFGLTKGIMAQYDNILFDSEPYMIKQSIYNKNFEDQ